MINVKAISTAITSKIGRQVLTVQKHSPTLLFGAGVVGVVTTVVLASRATLKLEGVLEETQRSLAKANMLDHPDYSEQDRKRDLTLIYVRNAVNIAKLYGPAIAVGVASVGVLGGSHVILNRRNVALTAAYAAVEKGFAQYRKRVVDEFGEDKDRELRYGFETREIVEETEEGPQVRTIKQPRKDGASIYARFFDESSTSWNKTEAYNQLFIRCQQNYANDLLRSRGHVFLNEIYDMLGLPRSKEGAIVGWILYKGGDNYIDFGVFEGDTFSGMRFVNGEERSILLDFNVDGVIFDKI